MKYLIREVRETLYTVEVPDGIMPSDLRARGLDSAKFWARGCGGIIAEQAECTLSIEPASVDDDEPADVVLDEQLRDTWPPEQSAVPAPHLARRPWPLDV